MTYPKANMKVLSIRQPWAQFISMGLKSYETRFWGPEYRGPLLIHASKRIAPEGRQIYEKIRSILGPDKGLPEFNELPRGAILCEAELKSTCDTEILVKRGEITFLERALGDFSPGRYAWLLRVTTKYQTPVTVKGRPGIWNFEGLPGGRWV